MRNAPASADSTSVPAVVLGGSGYVAGELLRLISGHPQLRLAAIMSDSQPGTPIAQAFPHLACQFADATFVSESEMRRVLQEQRTVALLSAAPHGVSAGIIDRALSAAEASGTQVRCVDISADFRLPETAAFETTYGHAHPAPHRLPEFTCALPEHSADIGTAHVAHPGCFATAAILAIVPLVAANLIQGPLFISGVTGSTGSGRTPTAATHHPLRHGDFYSYGALTHRHTPEILNCVRAATGRNVEVQFVPHSGPFARGIHVTVQAMLAEPAQGDEVLRELSRFYAAAPFVRVSPAAPRIKEVVSSNYAHLSATTKHRSVAVMCVIDNLVKGAAGGALQWMNRLLGWNQTLGLTAPAPGWT